MTAVGEATTGNRARLRARRECGIIRRGLADRRRPVTAIHAARKAIRRLRALLALVGDRPGDVDAVDRRLQRLGDGLSTLRDAQVAVLTAQAFAQRGANAHWRPALAWLAQRRDRIVAAAWARDPGFQRRRAVLDRCQAALGGLDWEQVRRKDLRAGLDQAARRANRAERKAAAAPSADKLHRWRRRLRRLRMQLEIVRAIAPETAGRFAGHATQKRIKALHKRGDRLGWQRDVEALRNLLRRMPGTPERAACLAQLRDELAAEPLAG